MGHGVCVVRSNKGTTQGMIVIPVAPATPAKRPAIIDNVQLAHSCLMIVGTMEL